MPTRLHSLPSAFQPSTVAVVLKKVLKPCCSAGFSADLPKYDYSWRALLFQRVTGSPWLSCRQSP